MLRPRRLLNRGDTIVEVMIAVTVITVIITSGYTIANRSILGARIAQEHTEALKIAEGQVERIKAYTVSGQTAIFNQAGGFCMDSNNSINTITAPSPTASVPDTYSRYPAACKLTGDSSGACTATYCYYTGIRRAGNTFTVTVRWDNARGKGQDQVRLVYRIYP